jgi:hypothetical protein
VDYASLAESEWRKLVMQRFDEWDEAMAYFQAAKVGATTIRWLAVVGATVLAAYGFLLAHK